PEVAAPSRHGEKTGRDRDGNSRVQNPLAAEGVEDVGSILRQLIVELEGAGDANAASLLGRLEAIECHDLRVVGVEGLGKRVQTTSRAGPRGVPCSPLTTLSFV